MDSWCQLWKVSLAAIVPMFGALPAQAEEDPPKTTKTMTVVVKSDEGDVSALLDRVRSELKNSGISEEEQKKILAQVEGALSKASEAKKEWSEAGKAAADAAKDTATIVVHSEAMAKAAEELAKGKEKITKELRVQALKMEDLRKAMPQMLQGQVVQGFPAGGPGVPSFRIGIALSNTMEHEEGDDEGDDEDEESEEEEVGLKIEDVMDDSPASKAGIQSGDVVVAVNGEDVEVFTQVQEAVQAAGKEEKPLVLTIRRNGKDKEVKVTPVKTDESDVSVMNLNLIPQDGVMISPGFVFRSGEPYPGGEAAGGAFTWSASAGDESLKKEISELKEEISELKAMVKKLLEK